jgi:hypothetical protein
MLFSSIDASGRALVSGDTDLTTGIDFGFGPLYGFAYFVSIDASGQPVWAHSVNAWNGSAGSGALFSRNVRRGPNGETYSMNVDLTGIRLRRLSP